MNKCFHCGKLSVIYDRTCSLEELGLPGIGMAHIAHCVNCGSEVYTIFDPSGSEVSEQVTVKNIFLDVSL